MKKAGLIGGMGPESTIPYYRDIVFGVNKRTNPRFFPNLTVESLNVYHILDLIGENKLDELTGYVLEGLENLKRSGADFAVLTANTTHIIFDRLAALSPLPLISIVEATCRKARRRGYDKIGLLGTVFTMRYDFYKLPFEREGIEVVVPDEAGCEYIDRIISDELEMGIVSEETRRKLVDIIERMKSEHRIEAVVLGCTELPMILSDRVSPVPCLDTVQIHVAEIIEKILI